mmetsp:Transcript_21021/g.27162  ORF Transcript_21021/g.27162 Transcript_21021/m.27162 type:complete len:200 (-) Transcript_21021:43-642(-)|eukprot:CAMPEP_0198141716 /NCGR_PEP_ID=MMETSP1443-20131203/4662_1 /TAXON_ID=186043 /ORGANISM="Entomoneis sp., Strain CCMP2396" /LENGTH=199 /DNA_ID=CAMNT_0043804535 /DNA_START=133 /DNA_END=732 /DNA_ORIENTATION=-
MAKGRFNKRAGGARLDAVSAEEIELRNSRLEEVGEQRLKRRAEAEEEAQGEGEKKEEAEEVKDEKKDAAKKKDAGKKKAGDEPDVPVTTEFDHRRNMSKLAEVRKRREDAEKRRKADEEGAKQLEEEQKKLAAIAIYDDEDDGGKKKKGGKDIIPKLDKIAIKKMKPAVMKEHLKTRGLEIQGNAKQLQQRLLDYEEAR